jgi:hypothetical protein
MFQFLKTDPAKKVRDKYIRKLAEAVKAQRNGDLNSYATLSEEADALAKSLDALEKVG